MSGVTCGVEHTFREKFCGEILIVQLEKIEPKTLDKQETGFTGPFPFLGIFSYS